ncbi:MAG: AbrB/MazE/SpoVT family DNA-binding domain-containing protein [Nitrospira sp.]
MDTAHVTTRGRIVILARLREKLGIKLGTRVRFIEHGSEILLLPLTKEYIPGVCGMPKGMSSGTDDLLIERRKDNKREEIKCRRIVVP